MESDTPVAEFDADDIRNSPEYLGFILQLYLRLDRESKAVKHFCRLIVEKDPLLATQLRQAVAENNWGLLKHSREFRSIRMVCPAPMLMFPPAGKRLLVEVRSLLEAERAKCKKAAGILHDILTHERQIVNYEKLQSSRSCLYLVENDHVPADRLIRINPSDVKEKKELLDECA